MVDTKCMPYRTPASSFVPTNFAKVSCSKALRGQLLVNDSVHSEHTCLFQSEAQKHAALPISARTGKGKSVDNCFVG